MNNQTSLICSTAAVTGNPHSHTPLRIARKVCKPLTKAWQSRTATKCPHKLRVPARWQRIITTAHSLPLLFNCQPLYKLLFVQYGTKQYISVEQATEYGINWVQTELRFNCPLCFLIWLSFYSSFKLLKGEFKTYFYLKIQSVPRSKHNPSRL